MAEYIYDLRLQPASTPQVDAHTDDRLKLTGGTKFGLRWSSQMDTPHADILIALKLSENGFAEIYNGPFPLDLLEGRLDQRNGQVSIALSKLLSINPSLLPTVHSFASINRWFNPKLSEVA